MQDIFYQVALSLVPGVGTHSAKQLITHCGSAEQVFKTSIGKLQKIPNIRDNIAFALQDPKLFQYARDIIVQAEKLNIHILFLSDPLYPKRLKEIPDAPLLLYYKGTADLNSSKIIGIVGTRKATPYGKECLEQIISELAVHNPIIVSGLAYGIDIHAHKVSLKQGLNTIGVLGSGIQRIYPEEHQKTGSEMSVQGGLLSEYQPNTKAEIYHFPARNRIIAGLCDGIIVAEAAEKGGALITADLANSYDREVMAIPGNLNYNTSLGCHNLIKNNLAHLITSGKDVASLLNWDLNTPLQSKFSLQREEDLAQLNQEERALYNIIADHENIHIDDLAWQANTHIAHTANILLQLEMQGLIKMMAGKKIKTT